MKLWQRLYNMVWLSVFACTLVPRWFGRYAAIVHGVVGVVVFALTRANAKMLDMAPVPDRLKRISKAVALLAAVQGVLGLGLGALHAWPAAPWLIHAILDGAHVFLSLAILAQSSSLATGYDMWEEHELAPAPSGTVSAGGAAKKSA